MRRPGTTHARDRIEQIRELGIGTLLLRKTQSGTQASTTDCSAGLRIQPIQAETEKRVVTHPPRKRYRKPRSTWPGRKGPIQHSREDKYLHCYKSGDP